MFDDQLVFEFAAEAENISDVALLIGVFRDSVYAKHSSDDQMASG